MELSMELIKPKYYQNNIYYCDTFEKNPKCIVINGSKYFRFIDIIYIPTKTELLTNEQIIDINDLRNKYFHSLINKDVNEHVRKVVSDTVKRVSAQTILEFGAGYRPLFHAESFNHFTYYIADLNPKAVSECKSKGFDSFLFNDNSLLPLSDESIDLVFSIFVFQFRISFNQIKEFSRILRKKGVILANVYRRNFKSKSNLLKAFNKEGFYFDIISDPEKICKNHEYWCLYKEPNSPLVKEIIQLIKSLVK